MLDSKAGGLGMLQPDALLHQCTGTSIYGLRGRYKLYSYCLGSVYIRPLPWPAVRRPTKGVGRLYGVWVTEVKAPSLSQSYS